MTKLVAFLRAINVGTTNRITMVKLSALFESRTPKELSVLIKRNPFAEYDAETHKYSVSFLKHAPTATPTERS
jgi:uncharacterized protein (DUF1697 family)